MGRAPIVIYAATGYTGRLIAAELRERGEEVAAAESLDGLAEIGVSSRADAPRPALAEVPA